MRRITFDSSQLRRIALVTMLIDHVAVVFGIYLWMGTGLEYTFWTSVPRWIGRLAFPIFAFLLARGCDKTRSLPRYAGRLALLALISQIPYTLALHAMNFSRLGDPGQFPLRVWDLTELNILFTLLLGLAAIALWKQGARHWLWRLGALLPLAAAYLLDVDYGMLGVLLIFCLWKFPSRTGTCVSIVSYGFLHYLAELSQVPRLVFTSWPSFRGSLLRVLPWLDYPEHLTTYMPFLFFCLSLVFLLSYNGRRGDMKKWTAYVFYPAHLLVLALLREGAIALGLFQ